MTQISERTLNPPRRRRPRQSLPPLSSFPLPCGTLLSQWKWERPRHGLGHYLPFIAALQVGCRMLSLSQSVEGERQHRVRRKMQDAKKMRILKTACQFFSPSFRSLLAFVHSQQRQTSFLLVSPAIRGCTMEYIHFAETNEGGWLDIVMEVGEKWCE